MDTSKNNFDSIEEPIYNGGLRSEALVMQPATDTMLVILNTKAVLHQRISFHERA